MPKIRLIITLLVVLAVLIVAIAIYLFSHYANISLAQGIILVVIATIVLLVSLSILITLLRGITRGK